MKNTPGKDIDQAAVMERAAIQQDGDETEVTMAMLFAAAHEPDEWILDGLIEKGDQVVLAGAPKAGKSLMASQIALAVASGGQFLGWRAPVPRKVLYINLEIRRKRFSRRIAEQIGGWGNMDQYHRLSSIDKYRTIDILDADERRSVSDDIKRINPDFLVWDVLARMHMVDEKDQAPMKLVMQAIRVASQDRAHIIVHHSRKQSSDNAGPQTATDIRGSGAIHGEVDLAMVLSKRPGQGARYCLTFSARNVDPPDELLLNIDSDLNFHHAAADEADKVRRLVQEVFRSGAAILATDLQDMVCDAFDIKSRSRAADYIKQAVDDGLIKRQRRVDRRYEYILTDHSPILRVAK